MIKVLFVCLGNICRSPMAEFVLKNMVREKGISENFEIDSAATEGYNAYHRAGMYYEARKILDYMKIPYDEHIARKITKNDYKKFDYILAMDEQNIEDIIMIVGSDTEKKIYRLLDFTSQPRNIRDPWYTGNFDESYWDIYEGCQCFLDYLDKNRDKDRI